jgi:hypothetical protein
MQSKLNELVDVEFLFSTLIYKVKKVKEVNGKAVIETNRRTFCFLPSELDEWIKNIKILDATEVKNKKREVVPAPEVKVYTKEVVLVPTALQTEIIKTNELSRRITAKLEDVFNELADGPSDEIYKKAAAMVNTSNAIMNMQVANYKFLTLK